jgi:hypothetical protein
LHYFYTGWPRCHSENQNVHKKLEMKNLQISEVFEKYIKTETKTISISTLLSSQYCIDPLTSRNFCWDMEKLTAFIESLFLGMDVFPYYVYFSGNKREVIDGRQRIEALLLFSKIGSKLRLKEQGLTVLKTLANLRFEDLDKKYKDAFLDAHVRVFEYSFVDEKIKENYEDVVKKEIRKRYNCKLTALKMVEVDKARYIGSDINKFFKDHLQVDQERFRILNDLFHNRKSDMEVTLKQIRKLLVIDKIPIHSYANYKEAALNDFFEITFNGGAVDFKSVYASFNRKIGFLHRISKLLDTKEANRLVFECLYWGMSVWENEEVPISLLESKEFEDGIIGFVPDATVFSLERPHYYNHIKDRYFATANFFNTFHRVDFQKYLKDNEAFREKRVAYFKKDRVAHTRIDQFENARLNKPDPISFPVAEICKLMEERRFLIRPIYQRNEICNYEKSSAIIESFIINIKLPPLIFFKRKDGIMEVVDGQQRLFSVLGYMGIEYYDEQGKLCKSQKNKFPLSLKNSALNGKRYSELSEELQDKIRSSTIWVIVIDEKQNPGFDRIGLFIRMNNRPFSIGENSFEMWNYYVDRDIINRIKQISRENDSWFFLKKYNSRMDNEDLLMNLVYVSYKCLKTGGNLKKIENFITIFHQPTIRKVVLKVKSKEQITELLEKPEYKKQIIEQISTLETKFLPFVKDFLWKEDTNLGLNRLLDSEKKGRKVKDFLILWLLISNVDQGALMSDKIKARRMITGIIRMSKQTDSLDRFKGAISEFMESYA